MSRAEQEGLLLILFEYAEEAARPWFESSARYYKRADFALMMFVYEVQTLWDKATSNVRFENTGALPFGWECQRFLLLLHAEDNGKSYRDALNKATERQIEVRFATLAEELMHAEKSEVDPADETKRSDVLPEVLNDRPQETGEDQAVAEHEDEEPQSSTDQRAHEIARFLSGDPEEVARAARDLARDMEELRPMTRAATKAPAHQTAVMSGETLGQRPERALSPEVTGPNTRYPMMVPATESNGRADRRGRPGKPERHRAIAAIALKYGKEWPDHLKDICTEIDTDRILPRETENWGKTWLETLAMPRGSEFVKKAIQASLSAAKKT